MSIMLIRLINEANFFVVFIALILVFFLLGFILGSLRNSGKKKRTETNQENSPPMNDTFGQDDRNVMDNQYPEQNQRPGGYGSRYNNYW